MQHRCSGVVFVILVALWLGQPVFASEFSQPEMRAMTRLDGKTMRHVRDAIDRGMHYLALAQHEEGGFFGESCERELSECKRQRSPFYGTFVIYALGLIEHPGVERMKRDALQYITGQMELGGLWRFYDHDDPDAGLVSPDLDDTACASVALTMHGQPLPDNLTMLFEHRDTRGAFYTWQDPSAIQPVARDLIDGLKRARQIPLDDPNDVDCGVNANVLLYLALRGRQAPEACDYVNERVATGDVPHCSLYYPNPMSILYMVTRAYLGGATCLLPSMEVIREWVLASQQPDGSWGNDLETACAVASLLHMNYNGIPLDRGIEAILQRQQVDGSWDRVRFIEYYHVTEIVPTAISLEALARYLKTMTSETTPS